MNKLIPYEDINIKRTGSYLNAIFEHFFDKKGVHILFKGNYTVDS
jgi:hypothetical protein